MLKPTLQHIVESLLPKDMVQDENFFIEYNMGKVEFELKYPHYELLPEGYCAACIAQEVYDGFQLLYGGVLR